MATAVAFQTVEQFPVKTGTGKAKPEVVELATNAAADKQIRVGPDDKNTRALLAQVRTYLSQVGVRGRKLRVKSKTFDGKIYWQVLNEPPRTRS